MIPDCRMWDRHVEVQEKRDMNFGGRFWDFGGAVNSQTWNFIEDGETTTDGKGSGPMAMRENSHQ